MEQTKRKKKERIKLNSLCLGWLFCRLITFQKNFTRYLVWSSCVQRARCSFLFHIVSWLLYVMVCVLVVVLWMFVGWLYGCFVCAADHVNVGFFLVFFTLSSTSSQRVFFCLLFCQLEKREMKKTKTFF